VDTSTDNLPDGHPEPDPTPSVDLSLTPPLASSPEGPTVAPIDGWVAPSDGGSDVPVDPADEAEVALTPEEEARRRRRRRWVVGVVAVLAVLTGAVLTAAVVRVPYYLLSPGGTFRTQNLITVKGAPSYPQKGSIEFVTVSVTSQRATALQWAWAHLDSSVTIAPADQIVPPHQSPTQNQQENFKEMADSKTSASVVALEHLGYQVQATGTGAGVIGLGKGSPASKVLHPGDTITAVDGKPVHLAEDLVAIIHAHHPGDTVAVTVDPAPTKHDKKPASVTHTVTLATNPTDKSEAFLGVALGTRDLKFPDLPVRITVSTPDVGGPSAGLAFTLGIMDVMTKGSLTGGHKVATTGTMDVDGNVGPIGGMHQKVLAVKASGAQEFLVPRSESAEARRYAGTMKIVPVDTIDQALTALTALGGGNKVLPKTAG
jgi:Lon-like protease